MRFRYATLKDVPKIVEFWKEFTESHDRMIVDKNIRFRYYIRKKKDAADILAEFIGKTLRSRNGKVVLAEDEKVIAGYCFLYIRKDPPVFRSGQVGYISDLYVREEFRGQKVSSKFKKEAVKWFKEKGLKIVSIGVYPANEYAHSIYEHWGFFDFHIQMRKRI